jgi:hypothetical protein
MTAPTRSASSSSWRRCVVVSSRSGSTVMASFRRVQHPADHAVDEQHRVVAGLARRCERTGRGRAWEQALPRLTGDDERVEVGQQADPSVRLPRRRGVAGRYPAGLAVELGLLQFAS